MTLSVIEGRSPIAILFKCDFSYVWRVTRSLCICRASYCILQVAKSTDSWKHSNKMSSIPSIR